MYTLSWNCRGLGNAPAKNVLKRIVLLEHPQLVFLSETRLKAHEMESIKQKIRRKNMLAVDCMGEGRRRRGGVALLWGEDLEVDIQTFSLNHIDAYIKSDEQGWWRFTGVYGYQEEEQKFKTGLLFDQLCKDPNEPWLCGGDFNMMMMSHEKQGGNEFRVNEAEILRKVVRECNFEDLGYIGHDFTWTNNRGGEDNIQERLDRFFATPAWRQKFPGSYVTHLAKRKSDHLPLILCARGNIDANTQRKKCRIFRFEEMWLRDEHCEEVISSAWSGCQELGAKMGQTSSKLSAWGRRKFGDFLKELKECRTKMEHLMTEVQIDDIIAQMKALDCRMDELESREEMYWKQRSRQNWLQHGDKNTTFFHTKAKQREARNKIVNLKDAAGREYKDEDQITELLTTFFEELFTTSGNVEVENVIDKVDARVSAEQVAQLAAPFTGAEVYDALFQMHPTKAPGPDGMSALFFQKFWHIVGKDVVEKVLDILNNNGEIGSINQTYIVLIPKKKNCESPVDFRPISLCNVIYKMVSKVLANRLKFILPTIINESQSGFVPGRLITDNVLVAYECFHYLRKKQKGKKGFLGLKLDMSKAYDRVEWTFLEKMMLKFGFPERYVHNIMRCVNSASFKVLVNGQPSREFVSSRGLRQGDPLSPFLFIMCAEGLSALLRDAEKRGAIHGIKIARQIDPISHLFFADDSLLFVRASEDEVENVMDILTTYEAASGQKLNMDKSEMSFSRNIDLEKRNMLQMKLTFKAVEGHDKYLGLPTYIGSSKKQVFQVIQDRIWKKLKGWKEKYLSQAGREVLIKSIAQAIPTYAMQCFSLPKSILYDVEKVCRNFFWGQKGEERKTCWVAWEKLYGSKKEGGMGFRNMQIFNQAMLAKQAWRVMNQSETLMARVLKGKYFPKCSFWEAKVSNNMSYTWRSILGAREVIAKGARRIIGNGVNINIWHDPWVTNLPGGRVASVPGENLECPQVVRELWYNREWNSELIETLFSHREVTAIKGMQVPLFDNEDKWMWKYSRDGEYSVRSAYYMLLKEEKEGQASSSRPRNSFAWERIWGANLPLKIKHFAWRAVKEGLAVKIELGKRGVAATKWCPMCGEKAESVLHALVTCVEARNIWYLSPLRLEFEGDESSTFMGWCNSLEKTARDKDWWSIFWSLCWGIWLKRNAWVFENRKKGIVEVLHKALEIVGEFEFAAKVGLIPSAKAQLSQIWKPPDVGVYKVNTAMFKEGGVGLGGVVRDHKGEVVAATCRQMGGEMDVVMAEALAVRHGLLTAMEAGFSNLVMEMDNLVVFSKLKKGKHEATVLGSILHDIFVLSRQCHRVLFAFVKRKGNVVAHVLAKLSSSFEGLRVWVEEYPPEAHDAVMADLSASHN